MTWHRFFTSDQHFYHKRIMEICPETRKGESLEEMHELLIQNHNKVVKPTDQVWFLGDFSFGSEKNTVKILERLNGFLHLVRGNHDHWINSRTAVFFNEIHDYKVLKDGGQYITMMHYPIARWDRMGYGAWHLHGHSHGEYHADGRVLDVGIDARPQQDMGLWEQGEIFDFMTPIKYASHHKDRVKIEL